MRLTNSPRQLHVAPVSRGGIDAQQDSGQSLLLTHQRRAAELETTMLAMRAGARVLVDAAEAVAP